MDHVERVFSLKVGMHMCTPLHYKITCCIVYSAYVGLTMCVYVMINFIISLMATSMHFVSIAHKERGYHNNFVNNNVDLTEVLFTLYNRRCAMTEHNTDKSPVQ